MPDEIAQSQVIETEAAPEAGTETPQSSEDAEVVQPGTEDKESNANPTTKDTNPETGKSYTQAEVDKLVSERTAELQKQEAASRQAISRIIMQQQIAQLQAQEAQAQSRDKQDVENGLITQDEANSRATERQRQAQLRATNDQLSQRAEALGKATLANDLAQEYGIKADVLLKDDSLKTPLQMIQKAAKLALADRDAKLRQAQIKPEVFDEGPGAPSRSEDTFNGTVTQAQLDDDRFWEKHKDAILKAQREGKLIVK